MRIAKAMAFLARQKGASDAELREVINNPELAQKVLDAIDLKQRLLEAEQNTTTNVALLRVNPQRKVDANESKATDLESKVGANESKATDLETKVGANESKATDLESKVGANESKATDLETKADDNESKVDASESKADASETKVGASESKIDDNESKIDDNESKIASSTVSTRKRADLFSLNDFLKVGQYTYVLLHFAHLAYNLISLS